MADKKWSGFPVSTTADASDLFSFMDISEPNPDLKNRGITKVNLQTTLGAGFFQRIGTTISPANANDDLDMRSGNIFASNYESEYAFYVVSPTNTSGSRSFIAEALLTDATPLSEASKVTMYGLYAGSSRNFMDYDGQTDTTSHRSDLYEYNNGASSNSILLRYISTVNSAVNVIHNQQHMALNSVASQKIYTQFECLVANATAASEAGRMVFSAMNNGVLTPCLELDGLTGTIIGRKSLNMLNNDIFMVDPANTSATKSFNLTSTLTSAIPGSESAEVSFSGLKNGSEKPFFLYSGMLDNSFIYVNTLSIDSQSTSSVRLDRRTEIKTATLIAQDAYYAFDSIDTPVLYAAMYAYITSPTAGSFSGSLEYLVAENVNLVKYLELNGSTQVVSTLKQFSVGSNVPHASALIGMTSTTRGFLPPQMTTTERNAISSPAEGLEVYDLTLHQWFGWNATAWVILG